MPSAATGRARLGQYFGMRILDELVDLVFPGCCVCCSAAGPPWCSQCQPPSEPGPSEHPARAPAVFAAASYADELRTALLAYKERGNRRLAPYLAGYLADAVDCALRPDAGGGAVLVPVPSRRAAVRQRGGDHMLRLARIAGRQLGLPVLAVLTLRSPVLDSAGLSAEQRARNLAGRMAARAAPRSSSALNRPASPPFGAGPGPGTGSGQGTGAAEPVPVVVDDIVTTGATLAEAARALAAAGWPSPRAAVVAATRLRAAAAP